jgi:hypothetical protein
VAKPFCSIGMPEYVTVVKNVEKLIRKNKVQEERD